MVFFLIYPPLPRVTEGFHFAAAAFSEPSSAPPAGNVPPPLNLSSQKQDKAGDLEVGEFKARGWIDLGGEKRSSWVIGGGGCAWEGTLCSCYSDTSSVGSVAVTLGLTCAGGRVTNYQVLSFNLSSKDEACPDNPPPSCTTGLYSRAGNAADQRGFIGTLKGAITFIAVKVIKFWRKLF